MTQADQNQQHINEVAQRIQTAIDTAVSELKQQIANGTPAAALDFSALDNLAAAEEAEAAADAPPAPTA